LTTFVTFFGNTLGGQPVQTGEFSFPVDVCKGCLITFSAADMSPLYPEPNCAQNPAQTGNAPSALPCIVGQDLSIDCIQCQAVPDCHGALGIVDDAGAGGG
jgi:hypothetical protein